VAHDADAAAVADAARQLHSAHAVWNEYDRQSPVFACFDDGTLEAWLPAGWAFGDAPVSAGQWAPGSGPTAIATDGAMHSGRFHGKLHGAVRSPTFTLENETIHYRVSGRGGKIRLVLDGYFMNSYSSLLFKDFELDVDSAGEFTWRVQDGDLHRYRGHRAYIELEDAGDGHIAVDEIRFSNLREGPPPRPSRLAVALADRLSSASRDEVLMEHARALAAAVDAFRTGRVTRDQAKLVEWLLENSLLGDAAASSRSSAEELARLQQEVKRLGNEARPPERIVALTDGTAENERVHIRGNHRTLGEVVPRRLPEALGGAQPAADETGSGRLLLAEHVASTDNPLTAREMVNRIWRHLTGRGIVSTVDNFGAMGSPPTHPELLDHLAMRLANGGWSVKRLIRAIVLSSTYRMASTPTESGQRLDPANHLIHAMRIRRLEGEAIRDAILAVSGRLDPALYGASVPVHLTSFMQGRGRPGESGPLDGDGRRSLYICVRRNFLSPMMLAFDTPIPFTTIGRRNASNVPAQALFLMNDPFVGGEARRWAENLLAQPHESPEHRLRWMYLQALGRPPTPAETQAGFRFCARQAEEYGIDPSAWQVDGRVWADLCHVVLNLKEFILIY
jgi:hypothetical protein